MQENFHLNVMMTHLHDVHGIRRSDGTFEKYVYSYFERPKCCCGQCENMTSLHCRKSEFKFFADKCPNQQRFKNVFCPEYYLFRGATVAEVIVCISQRQQKIAAKSVTSTHCKNLSLINSGDLNPSSIENIKARTGECERDIRIRLSKQSSGINNGFAGKKHRPETLRQLAIKRAEQAKQISAPELIIWGMLHALDIDFDYQVPIDKYVVDFKIGNLLVEIYGDYWHGTKMTPSNRRRDREKERFLAQNYQLMVIFESKIISDPDLVVKELCELKK